MARKSVAALEPMEVFGTMCDVDSTQTKVVVTLEEAEGYAVEFAKAILFGYGFTEEAIERTVNGYANDMWLKQHPRGGDTASKPTAPKVPVEAIRLAISSMLLEEVYLDSGINKRALTTAISQITTWLSAQEKGDR